MKNLRLGKKQFVLFSVCLIAIIAVIIAAYLFLIRQPDSNYEEFSKSLTTLKDKQRTVTSKVSSMAFPFFITDDSLSEYKKSVAEFSSEAASINKNVLITKDSKIKEAYAKYNDDVSKYIASNKSLVDSIQSYFNVASVCGKMAATLETMKVKTASVFDANSSECKAAVIAGESAPDDKFNLQFYEQYLVNTGALYNAYQQEFSAGTNSALLKSAQATIVETTGHIQGMNSIYSLDLKRSPDPSSAIDQLSSVVSKQKNTLIR
jgi:hypothetical protein